MCGIQTTNPSKPNGKPRIIYLFYDGIGLGKHDTSVNPFSRYALSYLSVLGDRAPSKTLPQGWYVTPTDAQLGVPGLPQSATGQTALWTGVNGALSMGCHVTAFPGPTLIQIIEQHSIIKKLCEQGYKATLLNAYTTTYLQRMQDKPRLRSVSSHLQKSAGLPYMTLEDLRQGRALYMDYTHEIMHLLYPELEQDFPIHSAYERGAYLARLARNYDLVIHEFFLTDKAGHKQSWEMAEWCIRTIEDFLDGLVQSLDTENELLLITSDHGNLEDLTTKTHTAHPVPTFAYGKLAKQAIEKIKSITDIPLFIYEVLDLSF